MEWRTRRFAFDLFPEGDRVVFAFLPHRCEDGKTRWLCKVRKVTRWFDHRYGSDYLKLYYPAKR